MQSKPACPGHENKTILLLRCTLSVSHEPNKWETAAVAQKYDKNRDAGCSLTIKASWKEPAVSALHSPGPLNNSDLVELQMASPKMIYFCVSWSTVPLKRPRSHHGSTQRLYYASSRGEHCTSRSKTYMRRRGCAGLDVVMKVTPANWD